VAEEYLRELNPEAQLVVFGQDYNPESYAICGSDMMIKGKNLDHIVFGDSFTADGFRDERFDYLLANPPSGWSGNPRRTSSGRNTRTGVTPAGSAPACPGSMTARCSSCST